MFDNFIADLTSQYMTNQDLILILILIFVFAMTYALLNYTYLFKNNKKVSVLISVCIAFMTVFFTKENWIIYTYLLPFKTLTLVLFYAIPLLLLLAIAHGSYMSAVGRKFLFIIFLIIQSLVLFQNVTDFSFTLNEEKYILVGITILLIILDTPINKLIKSLKK